MGVFSQGTHICLRLRDLAGLLRQFSWTGQSALSSPSLINEEQAREDMGEGEGKQNGGRKKGVSYHGEGRARAEAMDANSFQGLTKAVHKILPLPNLLPVVPPDPQPSLALRSSPGDE